MKWQPRPGYPARDWLAALGLLVAFAAAASVIAASGRISAQSNASTPDLCAGYGGLPASVSEVPDGMVWIPGGSFTMGSETEYPEERPAHEVAVHGFWIDRHPVTNAQFARFVAATGYVTVAERTLPPDRHRGVPTSLRAPGSAVFVVPERGSDVRNPSA